MSKEFFIKRYNKFFPDIDIDSCSLKDSIRINTLKSDEKELVSRLKKENIKLKKIPFLKYGYWYESEFSLGSTPEYLQGYYYLQETSSQIPAEILNPKKDDVVLDMAAAPGSKTTHLAQLMENKGTIVALDNVKWRLFALRNNLERCGVENVIIYNKDAKFVSDFKQEFDKILLDAPCTGNFLTDENWFSKRSMTDIKERSSLQKDLLRSAIKVLKKNGTLIYSTCSLEPEENEVVIDWALENLNVKLETIDFPIGSPGMNNVFGVELNPEVKKCLRILPKEDSIQPFFIAKIKRLK